MPALDDFRARIKAELEAADKPSISADAAPEYMALIGARYARFEAIADELLLSIVRPRMEILASHFPNTSPERRCEPLHCAWMFGYAERFPVSAKIDLSVGHDDRIKNLYLDYDLFIVPSFMKYDRHARLLLPIDSVGREAAAAWVEERLLDFIHTYLCIERTDRDHCEVFATDPVCKMRIRKDDAVLSAEYKGHQYFFCSVACRDKFVNAPTQHVTVVSP